MSEIVNIYEEYYVTNEISHFIKKLWTLNNVVGGPAIMNKGVLPNGCFTIAIVRGEGLYVKQQNQVKHLTEGVYFCGQITETIYVDLYPGTKATMIQLFPWTPVYFGLSHAELLTDKIYPIDEVAINPVLDPGAMIGLTNPQICRFITAAFSPLFRNDHNTSLIIESTQMIIANNGNISVSSIASSLNYSVRYLQKAFKNYIGVSPKVLLNIIKLRQAVDDIAYPNINSLKMTELALANNFYDQSHFNNRFASVIKTTPKNFNKRDFLLSLKK